MILASYIRRRKSIATLTKDPTCAPVLHLLGVLAFQVDQLEAKFKLIDASAVFVSENTMFRMSLGAILKSKGQEEEVAAACHKCVASDLENLGTKNAEHLAEKVSKICTGNLEGRTF